MKPCSAFFAFLFAIAPVTPLRAQIIPPNSTITVKLLAPLSTKTSRAGDKISAQVIAPAAFHGDFVGGTVREVKNGGKIHGRSVLNFTFDTLYHQGKAIPIASNVVSLMNSHGQENVDEEGEVVKKKNNIPKIGLATAGGGLLGGILGGWKGAAIGAAVGLAASAVLVETMAKGPSIDFAPGSEFVLSVKQRRGKIESVSQPPQAAPPEVATRTVKAPSTAAAPLPQLVLTVQDLTSNQPISSGEKVANNDRFDVTVRTANGIACAGQWVVTALGAPGAPPSAIVQAQSFIIGSGASTNSFTGPSLTANGVGNDWKVSASCNGAQPGQFAHAKVEFFVGAPAVAQQPPQTDVQATVRSGQTSIELSPAKFYIYGMVTSGGAQASAFTIQPYVDSLDAAGMISAALSYGTNPTDNFTTNTGYYVIGGASVSGMWSNVKTYYGSNSQSGASNASASFPVSTNSLVVVVGLASSQQSVSLNGVPGLTVDAASSGPGAPEGMVVAHAYLSPGNYTVMERSAALSAGQDPAHMTDLVGVFVFER